MRKMHVITGLAVAGLMGLGTYILVNKKTRKKADRLINNVLDKASIMTSDMID